VAGFSSDRQGSVKVDPAVLETYVGVYELTPASSIAITLENGQFMERTTHQRKFPLFPESQTKFFMKVEDAQFQFFGRRSADLPSGSSPGWPRQAG
jgi:Domain of unknown function (DUF3471)